MNKLHIAAFMAVFFSVYFGMHYFVFTRIANGLMLSGAARTALRIFFLIAALSFALTEFLTHRGGAPWLKPLADFGYIWLGVLSIAVAVFAVTEIIGIFFHGQSFKYNLTAAAVALIAVSSLYSLINVALGPVVREITIKTGKLPAGTGSLVIVQLSDLHIDMLSTRGWLSGIIDKTNSLEPDLVLITGDLIDSDICGKPGLCETLRNLKGRNGVYAVSGNHEFYTGMDKFRRTAAAAGFTIIDNASVSAAGVEIAGISDLVSAGAAKAEGGIRSVLSKTGGAGSGKFTILLSHRPDTFDAAAKLGVDLQLSGHTHAGQIPPMDLLVYFSYKYPWGLFRKGDSYCYTTAGTGTWGPRMRLFSRSEIVKIVLTR